MFKGTEVPVLQLQKGQNILSQISKNSTFDQLQ